MIELHEFKFLKGAVAEKDLFQDRVILLDCLLDITAEVATRGFD
jgi:hypothetical protein